MSFCLTCSAFSSKKKRLQEDHSLNSTPKNYPSVKDVGQLMYKSKLKSNFKENWKIDATKQLYLGKINNNLAY